MSSRSEQLTALETGSLGTADLLLVQRIFIWKRRAKWAFAGIAFLLLLCASLLIGYKLGTLLFSILQK